LGGKRREGRVRRFFLFTGRGERRGTLADLRERGGKRESIFQIYDSHGVSRGE